MMTAFFEKIKDSISLCGRANGRGANKNLKDWKFSPLKLFLSFKDKKRRDLWL